MFERFGRNHIFAGIDARPGEILQTNRHCRTVFAFFQDQIAQIKAAVAERIKPKIVEISQTDISECRGQARRELRTQRRPRLTGKMRQRNRQLSIGHGQSAWRVNDTGKAVKIQGRLFNWRLVRLRLKLGILRPRLTAGHRRTERKCANAKCSGQSGPRLSDMLAAPSKIKSRGPIRYQPIVFTKNHEVLNCKKPRETKRCSSMARRSNC